MRRVRPKHKPHPAVIAKAKAAKPPANAKKGNSIGKGKLAAKTDNAAAGTDSVWAEEIDIDGDGKVEQTDLLYDEGSPVEGILAPAGLGSAGAHAQNQGVL